MPTTPPYVRTETCSTCGSHIYVQGEAYVVEVSAGKTTAKVTRYRPAATLDPAAPIVMTACRCPEEWERRASR